MRHPAWPDDSGWVRTYQERKKAPRLVGVRGAKLAPSWEETGIDQVLQIRLRNAVTAVTLQTESVPGSSSTQAWRYSAHELGAIDLIARERLRRCRDDIAWGDLWPSFGGAGLAVEKDS
jgi:hypothetical protein